jgi:beta-aspartyl-peptidase (threonine type)
MIHGGAGALEDLKSEASEAEFKDSINGILERGRQRLEAGDSALDVLTLCWLKPSRFYRDF